jgi:hypothetical protein
MLVAFSSPPFYTKYVSLPTHDSPVPREISSNPKFFPYFANALGAVDGTHINCIPSAVNRPTARNRKGFLSQNCLMACTFDMRFVYVISGWDGSAADAAVYNDARFHDFRIPPGKFYLADAGFALTDELLVPYRGERYHLDEWRRGGRGPNTKEELFNLRHSSARNVVERIFGVLKRRFRILVVPPEYNMKIQSLIPPALCAIHNFIRRYDPLEIEDLMEVEDMLPANIDPNIYGVLSEGLPTRHSREAGADMRDRIAAAMWADYTQFIQEREAAILRAAAEVAA